MNEPWKPGEVVIYESAHGRPQVAKIERVTRSGRAIVAGKQFRRASFGYAPECGSDGEWFKNRIRRATPEKIAQIAEQSRRDAIERRWEQLAKVIRNADPAVIEPLLDAAEKAVKETGS